MISPDILIELGELDLTQAQFQKVLSLLARASDPQSERTARQATNHRYYLKNRLNKTTEKVLPASEKILIQTKKPLQIEPPRASAHAGVLYGEEDYVGREGKERKNDSSLRSELSTTPKTASVDLFGEPEKIPKAKAESEALKVQLRTLGEIWNELAGQIKRPQIDSIKPGSRRERSALRALRELRDDYEITPEAFLAKIRGSPFLRGERAFPGATFDWICNQTNLQKIIEGNFDEVRQKTNGNGHYVNGYRGQ